MTDITSGAEAGAAAPASAPWSIRARSLTVRYPNGVTALRDVDLDVAAGEMVSVVGLSGSGKSSLIRTINGLVPVTSGTLEVGGTPLHSARPRELRRLRGDIGMIFQGFNLAKRTSVLNNVLVGRLAHTPTWRTLLGAYTATDRRIAFEALDRVAIARALSQEPRLVLADEPVASLDPPTARGVMEDLKRINEDLGITVLTNLHLMDLARRYGSRMIGLRAGEIVYDGPAATATDDDFAAIYGRSVQREDVLEA